MNRPQLTAVKSSPQLGKHTPASLASAPPRVSVSPRAARADAQLPARQSPVVPAPPTRVTPTHTIPPPTQSRRGSHDEPGADYVRVPEEMYARIPAGAHIIYHKSGDAPGEFYGGFVKSHHKTPDGLATMVKYADRRTESMVVHASIDTMWKKYHQDAFIELWMTRAAIVDLRKQLMTLQDEVKALRSGGRR